MSGANIIYGAGMLELGMTFSTEQLVIDNDIIGMIKEVEKGIEVTDETIAYDAIKEVGSGNTFLSHMSTIENIGIQSTPKLMNRQMFGDWQMAGSKTLADAAHDVVSDILKNHEVEPIDSDIMKDLDSILKREDKLVQAAL